MPRARPNRYTSSQLDADLRRTMRRLRADADQRGEFLRYPDDDDLAALHGLAAVIGAADHLVDEYIVRARRRERRQRDGTIDPGTPVSWAQIGEALNISGQAAGKRPDPTGWP